MYPTMPGGYPMPYPPYPMVPYPYTMPGAMATPTAAAPTGEIKTLFVGNLAHTVTQEGLHQFFSKFGTVVRVKLMSQKNHAFITYSERSEAVAAKSSAHGEMFETRPLRINWGTETNNADASSQQRSNFAAPYATSAVPQLQQQDSGGSSVTTTLFVGNLAPTTDEEILRATFGPYGTITRVKLNPEKHFGFVSFETREEASAAKTALNEVPLIARPMRINWGH